jgi:hypothetical protein
VINISQILVNVTYSLEYIPYNVYSCKSCISTVHEGCLEEYDKKINCKGNGIHVFVKKKIHLPVSCEFCEKVITRISGGAVSILFN